MLDTAGPGKRHADVDSLSSRGGSRDSQSKRLMQGHYTYIYIYIERERERETDIHIDR